METLHSEYTILIIVATVVCYVIHRIIVCLPTKNASIGTRQIPTSCMVIFGSGGHTTEMLRMIKELDISKYSPMYFVTALSDHTSVGKIRSSELSYIDSVKWIQIYRSREVKQSWLTTVLTSAFALVQAFSIIAVYRPRLICCNGPGTCVPLCVAAFVLRVVIPFDMYRPFIVFAESYCRVQTLSLTGRILYYISDGFIVQWPNLVNSKYPRAKYIGKIC